MGICNYYQKGTCHFGSQCRNEHIYVGHNKNDSKLNDIRLVVTSETESALNGKQWILSCFAPFRDKQGVIIPGFIEDLSPEEVRWDCYQARDQGTVQQHIQLLSLKVQDAAQKMQLLKNGSAEVMSFLSELYNGKIDGSTNNPFCSNNMNFGNPVGNVFTQVPNPSYNTPSMNIFGGSSNIPFTSNSFAQPSVFTTTMQTTGNLFSNNNGNAFQAAGTFPGVTTANTNVTTVDQGVLPNTNIFAMAASNFNSNAVPQNSFSFTKQTNNIFGGNSSLTLPSDTNSVTNFQQSLATDHNFPTGNSMLHQGTTLHNNGLPINVFGSSPMFMNMNQLSTTNLEPTTNVILNNKEHSLTPVINSNLESNLRQTNQTINSNFESNLRQTNQTIFKNIGHQSGIVNNPFINNSKQVSSDTYSGISNKSGCFLRDFDKNPPTYTNLNELNPDELEEFKNDNFKLGSIPRRAPPSELCDLGNKSDQSRIL